MAVKGLIPSECHGAGLFLSAYIHHQADRALPAVHDVRAESAGLPRGHHPLRGRPGLRQRPGHRRQGPQHEELQGREEELAERRHRTLQTLKVRMMLEGKGLKVRMMLVGKGVQALKIRMMLKGRLSKVSK